MAWLYPVSRLIKGLVSLELTFTSMDCLHVGVVSPGRGEGDTIEGGHAHYGALQLGRGFNTAQNCSSLSMLFSLFEGVYPDLVHPLLRNVPGHLHRHDTHPQHFSKLEA